MKDMLKPKESRDQSVSSPGHSASPICEASDVPQAAATTQTSARQTCALAADSRRLQRTNRQPSPADNQEFGLISSEIPHETVSGFEGDADQEEKPSPQENKVKIGKERNPHS